MSIVKEKLTIVLAEDDIDDIHLFKLAVEEVLHRIDLIVAENGSRCMNVLDSIASACDIVFLDINMPRKNGLQALEEIRQSENLKNVPVIIFTTSDDIRSIEQTKVLGANIYITKPSFFSSFKKAISHCLAIDWSNFNPATDQFVLSFN